MICPKNLLFLNKNEFLIKNILWHYFFRTLPFLLPRGGVSVFSPGIWAGAYNHFHKYDRNNAL